MTLASLLVFLASLFLAALSRIDSETTASVIDIDSYVAQRLGNQSSGLNPTFGLGKRQAEVCTIPGGVICPNDPEFCCPPDQICQIAILQCCPSFALQCGGEACCDPSDAICCPSVSTGCCLKGATCCGSDCCPPDFECKAGECVAPVTASTTTSRTTTTSPASCTSSLEKRQAGSGNACSTSTSSTPTSTQTKVPTVKPLTFDYQRLSSIRKPKYSVDQMEARQNALVQLFTNLCLGLESRGQLFTQSDIYTFVEDETVKNQNRRAAGCFGLPCVKFTDESCDEFPFASTEEGGLGAIWNCIPQMAQDIQGGVISSWKRINQVTAGSVFELQVVNYDCIDPPSPPVNPIIATAPNDEQYAIAGLGNTTGTTRSLFKRFDTITQVLSSEQDVFPPFDDSDPYNHSLISLGDLTAGSYHVSAQVTGSVSSAYIIDSEGALFDQVTTSDQTSSTIALNFNLTYPSLGLSIVMDTLEDQITYNATVEQVSTNTSSTPSAGEKVMVRSEVGVAILVLLATAILFEQFNIADVHMPSVL